MIPCTIEKTLTHPTGSFKLRIAIELPLPPWEGMLIFGLWTPYGPVPILQIPGYDCFAKSVVMITHPDDTTDPLSAYHNWTIEALRQEFLNWGWEKLDAMSNHLRDQPGEHQDLPGTTL